MGEFNAKEMAHWMELAAKDVVHDMPFAGDGFSAFVSSMSPEQLKLVAKQVEKDNWKPNTLPRIEFSADAAGNIDGITIRAAKLDFGAKVSTVWMGAHPGERDLEELRNGVPWE